MGIHLAMISEHNDCRFLHVSCFSKCPANATQSFIVTIQCFLDLWCIQSVQMSVGIYIRQMDQKVIIMFITNMIQYAVRGYEVDAMDYVVKPVEYFSFSQKLDKAVGRMRSEVKEFLTIPIGEGVVKIDIADIYFIEGQRHNVIYHTSRGDYCSRITMKELEEKLAVHNFFRCAKGYLVNMNHVEGFVGSDCVIHNVHIPVSRTRKKEFMNLLLQNLNME